MIWSQDGGASWSDRRRGLHGYGSRGVAFDPPIPSVFTRADGWEAFFKSSDGGRTWSRRFFGSPAVYVIAVAVDPLSPNIVYAGTQNEGIFKSTDYGDTWAAAGSGPTGAITYLTPDPTKSGRLFASTANAFFLSEDGGATWSNVMNVAGMDRHHRSQYAFHRVRDRQNAGGVPQFGWRPHLADRSTPESRNLTMGRSAPVIIDPTNPLTLYVGSEGGGGVFKSLDGGSHWFAVNSGIDDLRVEGLAMDPGNPAVLYACGPSGVYKTVNGGEE